MQVTELAIPGLLRIEPKIFRDDRGFFLERFQEERFRAAGLPFRFVQDNHSRSAPGVLRGLHYQLDPDQGKLVGATRGRIWDVAVDLRPGSATRGRHVGIELDADQGTMIWIPGGFAHGFCVLGTEPADVVYKVDVPYDPKREHGVHWADPTLAIRWPIANPLLSPRDQALPRFAP